MYDDSHLSDQQLLQELDHEIGSQDLKRVQAHLGECWKCRARRQELERATAEFVRHQERELARKLPPVAGQRALLRARLAESSDGEANRGSGWFAPRHGLGWAIAAGVFSLLALSWLAERSPRHGRAVIISVPDSRLTPGAALLESRQAVCTQTNTKNKAVPVALQRRVFDAYGISSAGRGEYELDYLITPALGGADDIHNLWPQSASATVWNAEVKDVLEDRLREMVCDGQLDLREAQEEIAGDWIAAYKKYFHTDQPLAER